MNQKKIPMRMCVVCREMKPKNELVRIVAIDGKLFLDKTMKHSGRGAYICNNTQCFDNAKKRGSLARAFSVSMSDSDYATLKESIFGEN